MAAIWLLVGTSFLAGCGGGDETAETTAATTTATTAAAAAPTTVGAGQAETVRDAPFELNTQQPVPPDFAAAYERNALIAVQFYKEGQDPFYPQGLGIDERVNNSVDELSSNYPTVELFSYEITNPGDIGAAVQAQPQGDQTDQQSTNGDDGDGGTGDPPPLAAGEYGTLPAQLGVGYTPFLATLAPQDGGYIIENLFQGYVPRPVVKQALFDLSAAGDTQGNTSDVDVVIDSFDLTRDGAGLEYVSIENNTNRAVDLQGFTLRVLDLETGEVDPGAGEASINDNISIPAKRSRSVGRDANVVDSEGNDVEGVFDVSDGGLDLAPGDQLALLDPGGAIASTITI